MEVLCSGRTMTTPSGAIPMSAATKLVTIEEYEALGEDAPYELIRGVLYETMPTKFVHAAVAGQFVRHLFLAAASAVSGEVLVGNGGFHLGDDPDSVVVPDVAFIRAERIPPRNEWDRFCRVPP